MQQDWTLGAPKMRSYLYIVLGRYRRILCHLHKKSRLTTNTDFFWVDNTMHLYPIVDAVSGQPRVGCIYLDQYLMLSSLVSVRAFCVPGFGNTIDELYRASILYIGSFYIHVWINFPYTIRDTSR